MPSSRILTVWADRAREHPLLQSRLDAGPFTSPLDALLADPRPGVHQALSEALLGAESSEEALENAKELAQATPPPADGGDRGEANIREVAG